MCVDNFVKELVATFADHSYRELWDMGNILILVSTHKFGYELRMSLKDTDLGQTFDHHNIATPEAFCAKLLRGNASKVSLSSDYTILEADEEHQNNGQVYVDELVTRASELLVRYPEVEQEMEDRYPLVFSADGVHNTVIEKNVQYINLEN